MIPSTRPAWVFLGGGFLAFHAGILNVVGYLGVAHQAITHVTGTITQAGIGVAFGDFEAASKLAAFVGCFFAGALLSGLILQSPTLRAGRRYGGALLLEAGLLAVAWWLLSARQVEGEYFAAVAVGLQNALATNYSGAVIRTTHMTGIVTDLGLMAGHALRGQAPERYRVGLLLSLSGGFSLGTVAGAFLFGMMEYHSILFAAVNIALAGGLYTWTTRRDARRQASSTPPSDA